MEYSESELLAVLLAREVRDGEVSACGALSQIPAAGLLLAQALHAPNAELIILNSVFNPFRTSHHFHFLAQRGELGLFFVSGVQIDRHGNYNLHQLGPDPEHPTARFPGGYGGGMIYYAARRTVVFRTEHTRRSLVERVDYVSAAGATPPLYQPEESRQMGSGRRWRRSYPAPPPAGKGRPRVTDRWSG